MSTECGEGIGIAGVAEGMAEYSVAWRVYVRVRP